MGFFDKLQEDRPHDTTTVQQEMRRNKFFGWRDVIVCLLIVGVFLIFRDKTGSFLGLGGGLDPVLEETRFGITDAEGVTHFFGYAEADSIELFSDLKSFDKGEQVDGTATRSLCSGTWRNSEFGEYELHVQTKLKTYIVVHDAGGVLVFNLESDETTRSLYDYFIEQRASLKDQAGPEK